MFSDGSFSFLVQRHIYGYQGKNIQIFADNSSLAVNPSYIRSWLDLLSQTPRVAPFISKNDPFIMALKKVFFLSHFHGYACMAYFDDHVESVGNCWIVINISSSLLLFTFQLFTTYIWLQWTWWHFVELICYFQFSACLYRLMFNVSNLI